MLRRGLSACLLVLAPVLLPAQSARQETPLQLVDRGIARMGGDSLLRALRTVRYDVLTQWLRIGFGDARFDPMGSYERNVDLRDYATASWRNSRYFTPTAPAAGVVDVVRDTIAARLMPRAAGAAPTWGSLNVAYVDERRELFGFAPERLLLHLRDGRRVERLADTTINGVPHARLAATIEHWPSVVFLRLADALPTLVRFRADETNDFGLAPLAEHEVEFWYSNWGRMPNGVLLARQRDVARMGRPYKRMTLLAADVNAVAPADSFAVSDSVATAYLANDRKPMWRTALDGTARIERDAFATFPPMTGTVGAVRIGGRWVVLETAQAVGAMELVADWLGRHGGGAPIAGGIAANVWIGNGGVTWFTSRGLPVYTAPGAVAAVERINGGRRGLDVTRAARWVRIGSDSLWLEPLSAPDFAGTMAVYSPTLRWLWLVFAGSPTHAAEQDALIARLEARGLPVELIGGARTLAAPRNAGTSTR